MVHFSASHVWVPEGNWIEPMVSRCIDHYPRISAAPGLSSMSGDRFQVRWPSKGSKPTPTSLASMPMRISVNPRRLFEFKGQVANSNLEGKWNPSCHGRITGGLEIALGALDFPCCTIQNRETSMPQWNMLQDALVFAREKSSTLLSLLQNNTKLAGS